jgi:uncharacterized small protein (DUF1192 family)
VNLQERIAELEQQRDQGARDWAETDTQVRESAAKVLPHEQVYGSADGVPGVADLVDLLVAEVERCRAELHRRCQCRFADGKIVGECHYHACQRTVLLENGDPSDVTLVAEVLRLRAKLKSACKVIAATGNNQQAEIATDILAELEDDDG